MSYNLNSGYGRAQSSNMPYTTGKVFFVAPSSSVDDLEIEELYDVDSDGIVRKHESFSDAVGECVSGRGDVIVLAPDFSSSISDADLTSVQDKGVTVVQASKEMNEAKLATRSSDTLPQSGDKSLFDVLGEVKIKEIKGVVTTDIQNQTNNTKLVAKPSASGASDVDLCSTTDIANDTTPTVYNVSGTLSDSLQSNANGVIQSQNEDIIVPEGTIDLSCSASNSGEVRWTVKYVPLDPGGRVFAA